MINHTHLGLLSRCRRCMADELTRSTTHLTSCIQGSPHPVHMHPKRNWFCRRRQVKLFDFALSLLIMSIDEERKVRIELFSLRDHVHQLISTPYLQVTKHSLTIAILTQYNTSTHTRIDTMTYQWSMHNFSTNSVKWTQ